MLRYDIKICKDNTLYCYLDTIDECVGECKRIIPQILNLVLGKAKYDKLGSILTKEMFEKAFIEFIKQADQNVQTNKGKGVQKPFGVPFSEIKQITGQNFSQHFGSGAPSKTPYMNWYVVSIYYIVAERRIVVGIEEHRYRGLSLLSPSGYEIIGLKKERIAKFYETTLDNINYDELYNKFISVAEQIREKGLIFHLFEKDDKTSRLF